MPVGLLLTSIAWSLQRYTTLVFWNCRRSSTHPLPFLSSCLARLTSMFSLITTLLQVLLVICRHLSCCNRRMTFLLRNDNSDNLFFFLHSLSFPSLLLSSSSTCGVMVDSLVAGLNQLQTLEGLRMRGSFGSVASGLECGRGDTS